MTIATTATTTASTGAPVTVTLTYTEAIDAAVELQQWPEPVRCNYCDGSGLHPRRYDNTACPDCRGEGVLDCTCPGH